MILFWTVFMLAMTVAVVALEPVLAAGLLKWLLFISYVASAGWYGINAAAYGADAGLAGWSAGLASLMVVLAVIYLALATQKRGGVSAEEVEHEAHASNYVPAKPRRYRSVTRRTLNAIKVLKPREHWRVTAR